MIFLFLWMLTSISYSLCFKRLYRVLICLIVLQYLFYLMSTFFRSWILCANADREWSGRSRVSRVASFWNSVLLDSLDSLDSIETYAIIMFSANKNKIRKYNFSLQQERENKNTVTTKANKRGCCNRTTIDRVSNVNSFTACTIFNTKTFNINEDICNEIWTGDRVFVSRRRSRLEYTRLEYTRLSH